MSGSVWVLGRYPEPDLIDKWELQGVFEDKADAVAACRDWTYFVGEVPLNTPLPHDTEIWQVEYPLPRQD